MTRTMLLVAVCVGVLVLWGCPSQEPAGNTDVAMNPEPGGQPAVANQTGENTLAEDMSQEAEQAPADTLNVNDQLEQATASQGDLSGEVVDGVRVVKVEAKRYEFNPSTIVVKAGEPVRLEVTATDVEHGMYIGGMNIDVKLPPGETQEIEFTPEKPGSYPFDCNVYCGPGHDDMRGTLVVQR